PACYFFGAKRATAARSPGNGQPASVGHARPRRQVAWELAVRGLVDAPPRRNVERDDRRERKDALRPADFRLENVADPGRDPLVEEGGGKLGVRVERREPSDHSLEIDSGLAEVGAEALEHP